MVATASTRVYPPPPAPLRVLRTAVGTLAELILTFAVVLGLLAAWEVWGKSAEYQAAQHEAGRQLDQLWSAPVAAPAAPDPGAPFSRLYAPALGAQWTIVEGVTQAALRKGPGHYPGTQPPGGVGNFAVAGHRSPSVFWNLDRLHAGDALVVETRTTWFVYVVKRSEVVQPTQTSVVAPVPDAPGTPPTAAAITLTTCNPKWSNKQRLIVFGELARTQDKTQAGRPAELGA
ncbi:class E sortase [Amycolatopsis sp. NBC_01307]|uniref:class E sortase n=1 Tax=Amycolatopsis sp. NBC_01307 TaxID=2903561 RepID=UPI002E157641|nr:class E sortase [Amycolatopsis sp. NBC_01307]